MTDPVRKEYDQANYVKNRELIVKSGPISFS